MSLRHKLTTARRMGLRAAVLTLLRAAVTALYTTETLIVFVIGPDQLNPVTPELEGELWSMRCNDTSTLGDLRDVPEHVTSEMRSPPPGQRMHWAEVSGRVVSWGFSTPWIGPWALSETRSTLIVPPGGVCLTALETLPEFRGRRLYPSVLTVILSERFSQGARRGYIWCRQDNIASYRAIKRVGFQEIAIHRYTRLLGWARHDESSIIT